MYYRTIMNTITAKELRDNLQDVIKRVSAGEHIQVTYRNQPKIRLEPTNASKGETTRARFAGLELLKKAQKNASIPERYRTGDLKQLYREDMAKKYGITE